LLGDLGQTEWKVLFSVFAITVYSLFGLFFAWLYDADKIKGFAILGLVWTAFSFITTLLQIWDFVTKIVLSSYLTTYSLIFGIILCWLVKKKRLLIFSLPGLFVLGVFYLFSLLAIWDVIEFDIYFRVFLISLILFFGLLHSSLLWLAKNEKIFVNVSLFFTLAMIFILASLLMFLVISHDKIDFSNLFFRVLGAFAILDGIGTVVTLIIRKVSSL